MHIIMLNSLMVRGSLFSHWINQTDSNDLHMNQKIKQNSRICISYLGKARLRIKRNSKNVVQFHTVISAFLFRMIHF